nr:D-alanyl-D-alanine carboxypeptidase [Clostridiales bacterium]
MRQEHRTNGSAARRFLAVLLLLTALLLASFGQSGQVFAASEAPDTQCHGVLLYDQKTGEILYEKNADEPMTPASITKIMTAVLVLENI